MGTLSADSFIITRQWFPRDDPSILYAGGVQFKLNILFFLDLNPGFSDGEPGSS